MYLVEVLRYAEIPKINNIMSNEREELLKRATKLDLKGSINPFVQNNLIKFSVEESKDYDTFYMNFLKECLSFEEVEGIPGSVDMIIKTKNAGYLKVYATFPRGVRTSIEGSSKFFKMRVIDAFNLYPFEGFSINLCIACPHETMSCTIVTEPSEVKGAGCVNLYEQVFDTILYKRDLSKLIDCSAILKNYKG